MSNMPDINKKLVAAWIHLETVAKIRKFADAHKLQFSDALKIVIDRGLEGIELSEEDYLWIAEQVRINESKRKGGSK